MVNRLHDDIIKDLVQQIENIERFFCFSSFCYFVCFFFRRAYLIFLIMLFCIESPVFNLYLIDACNKICLFVYCEKENDYNFM